jgi:hypothetical protein
MATNFLEGHPSSSQFLKPGVLVKDCASPWERIDVTNTGEVLPCCFAQETLGNVIQLGLAGVLEGPRRLALQHDVMAGRLNSLCFNAACPLSRNTMKSAWATFFPPDRFMPVLGEWQGTEIAYRPIRGDGFIFGGPYRFLPGADMQAQFIFSSDFGLEPRPVAKDLSKGHVILEVVDAVGFMFARHEVPINEIESTPALRFTIDGYHRQRCEFRAYVRGVQSGLLFKGVRLTGTPL